MLNKVLKMILPFALVFLAFSFNLYLGLTSMVVITVYYIVNARGSLLMAVGTLQYQKNPAKAMVWFERAYKTGKLTANQKLHYGFMALRESRLEKAERLINAVLAFKCPQDVKIMAKSYQGLLYWKQGKLEDAIAEFEELHEKYKTTNIYANLGFLYILKGDMAKAEQFNLEAYDFNSENMIILDNLGQLYQKLGQHEKALEYQRKLMEQNPQFPTPHATHGDILYSMGDKAGALESYNKALEYRFSGLAAVTRQEIIEKAEKVRGEIEQIKEA